MKLDLQNLVNSDEELRILAAVDSAARQISVETMGGVDIQKQLDRMPPNARKWASENAEAFADLVQYHVEENRRKDLPL